MDIPHVALAHGPLMPVLGLGTSQLAGKAAPAVRLALEVGYRHIDTAKMYRTEAEIGRAIQSSQIPRDKIFVTTKLLNSDQGYESTLVAIDESLRELGLSYVDTYLVHWPHADREMRAATWRAMEKILESGKARSIGVSNFDEELLEEIESYGAVMPSVNQIEMHPFWYRPTLVEYCQKRRIAVMAYSPLTRSKHMDAEIFQEMAKRYNKSVAQLMLRWNVQHGSVVIPKASSREHLEENSAIFDFEISPEDLQALDKLSNGKSILR